MMTTTVTTTVFQAALISICSILLLLQSTTVLSQVTQSSYSEHAEEELHQNQIPPPQYQPSEDDVKKALQDLVLGKIDKDGSKKLSTEELRDWLEIVHHKIIDDNVEKQWKYYSPVVQEVHSWEGYAPEMKEVLNWEVFKAMTYPDEHLADGGPHAETMKKLMVRSEKRWTLADLNTDSVLTIEEFKNFVHPEESKNMQHILVDEAVEDMDEDNDSKITLDEYFKHLYSVSDETERDDPNWRPV